MTRYRLNSFDLFCGIKYIVSFLGDSVLLYAYKFPLKNRVELEEKSIQCLAFIVIWIDVFRKIKPQNRSFFFHSLAVDFIFSVFGFASFEIVRFGRFFFIRYHSLHFISFYASTNKCVISFSFPLSSLAVVCVVKMERRRQRVNEPKFSFGFQHFSLLMQN